MRTSQAIQAELEQEFAVRRAHHDALVEHAQQVEAGLVPREVRHRAPSTERAHNALLMPGVRPEHWARSGGLL